MSTLGALASAQGAALPAPVWRGVDEVVIHCRVEADAVAPNGDFCRAALEEARRGAPVAVRAADQGPGGVASLNLEITAATEGDALLLTVTGRRAVEVDESQGALLPRRTRARPDEALAVTLARALNSTLPWRRARALPPPFRQS